MSEENRGEFEKWINSNKKFRKRFIKRLKPTFKKFIEEHYEKKRCADMQILKCWQCGNDKSFEGTRKIADIETYEINSLDGRFNFEHYLNSENVEIIEQKIICLRCNNTWKVNNIDECYVEVNKELKEKELS